MENPGSIPPPVSPAPPPPPAPALRPLPYHRGVLEHLKSREPEVWRWFVSDKFRDRYTDTIRLELLKGAYRLDRQTHAAAYDAADFAASRLGVDAPVTIYQAQHGDGLNASLWYLPREAHLVLWGPVLATLSPEELRALFGHELSHFAFFHGNDGEFLAAGQALLAMADDPEASPAHVETARRFQLWIEILADRGALLVMQDPLVCVSSLVKITTGLADVNPAAYLKQAAEILAAPQAPSEGVTHPEAFLRARALELWARDGEAAEPEIARLLEGPLDVHRLDLPGQQAAAGLTRRFLSVLLAPDWMRSEPLVAHARLFFDDFPAGSPAADPSVFADLAADAPSTREYLTYVLLDFAAADPDVTERALARAFAVAARFGEADNLRERARRELGLPKKSIERADREAESESVP